MAEQQPFPEDDFDQIEDIVNELTSILVEDDFEEALIDYLCDPRADLRPHEYIKIIFDMYYSVKYPNPAIHTTPEEHSNSKDYEAEKKWEAALVVAVTSVPKNLLSADEKVAIDFTLAKTEELFDLEYIDELLENDIVTTDNSILDAQPAHQRLYRDELEKIALEVPKNYDWQDDSYVPLDDKTREQFFAVFPNLKNFIKDIEIDDLDPRLSNLASKLDEILSIMDQEVMAAIDDAQLQGQEASCATQQIRHTLRLMIQQAAVHRITEILSLDASRDNVLEAIAIVNTLTQGSPTERVIVRGALDTYIVRCAKILPAPEAIDFLQKYASTSGRFETMLAAITEKDREY